MFSYNVRFSKNNKRLFDQARKLMFAVLRKSRKLRLPVDIQLQLVVWFNGSSNFIIWFRSNRF